MPARRYNSYNSHARLISTIALSSLPVLTLILKGLNLALFPSSRARVDQGDLGKALFGWAHESKLSLDLSGYNSEAEWLPYTE